MAGVLAKADEGVLLPSPDEVSGQFAETCLWDGMLRDIIPTKVLSFQGPANQTLLRFARLRRSKPGNSQGKKKAKKNKLIKKK